MGGAREVKPDAPPVRSEARSRVLVVVVLVVGVTVCSQGAGGNGGVSPRAPRRPLGMVGLDRVVMILPQVHLRKPCYDFTFL